MHWLTLGLIAESFVPSCWLGFSLTYSRSDWRDSITRYRFPLAVVTLLPIGLALGFWQPFFELVPAESSSQVIRLQLSTIATVLNVILLVSLVWVLMNLEQTFRSAIGTMRWRIKFVVLGLAVIFCASLYVRSQALLFSAYDTDWQLLESTGLLVGCVLLMAAYLRTGYPEIEVYPSRSVLRSSLTLLIAGGYLLVVGILAKIVDRFGGIEGLQLQSFVVLLGMAGLAILLLSDRFRQRIQRFVSLHFSKAQYDSVRIWTELSRRLVDVKDQTDLCRVSARLLSETFEVLSARVWLLDDHRERYSVCASTASKNDETNPVHAPASLSASPGLRARSSPFDLEGVNEPWAEELRRLNPSVFPNGGDRWCVPLRAGEENAGFLVLADRVNGVEYTAEEVQLLQCIADQLTLELMNLRLVNEVARARELEAFRTMSAFVVHDLKNSAATLNLMLKNFSTHFGDPAFREDALRGIANMSRRIDETVGRLTSLRQRPDFHFVKTDLNQLVSDALEKFEGTPDLCLTTELKPLPEVLADCEQIQSVVTNLFLNAKDAIGPGGRIHIRTEHLRGAAVLSVIDNGCGMSPAFVKDSLFRPFQSTKKKGLGIGLFQSRMIVEAHGGTIRVESEAGKGTTFLVSLPVQVAK